jgi:hypothetical protein
MEYLLLLMRIVTISLLRVKGLLLLLGLWLLWILDIKLYLGGLPTQYLRWIEQHFVLRELRLIVGGEWHLTIVKDRWLLLAIRWLLPSLSHVTLLFHVTLTSIA